MPPSEYVSAEPHGSSSRRDDVKPRASVSRYGAGFVLRAAGPAGYADLILDDPADGGEVTLLVVRFGDLITSAAVDMSDESLRRLREVLAAAVGDDHAAE